MSGDPPAATLVGEDTLAPDCLQRIALQGKVLVGRRDPRVVDLHASLSDQITGHASD
jgi:hypothetical protein